jgi:hypothetical protein
MSNRMLTGRVIRIFLTSSFVFEQGYYFRQRVKELILIIQTAMGDLSARPSERRRVICFLHVFERLSLADDFRVRRCISRVESVDSILQKWERKMSVFRWWGSQFYSPGNCKFRPIQRTMTDPTICRGQILHVDKIGLFPRWSPFLLRSHTLQMSSKVWSELSLRISLGIPRNL